MAYVQLTWDWDSTLLVLVERFLKLTVLQWLGHGKLVLKLSNLTWKPHLLSFELFSHLRDNDVLVLFALFQELLELNLTLQLLFSLWSVRKLRLLQLVKGVLESVSEVSDLILWFFDMQLKFIDCLVESFFLTLTFFNFVCHILDGKLGAHKLLVTNLRALIELSHLQFQLLVLSSYWRIFFVIAPVDRKHSTSTAILVFAVFLLQQHSPLVQIDMCWLQLLFELLKILGKPFIATFIFFFKLFYLFLRLCVEDLFFKCI